MLQRPFLGQYLNKTYIHEAAHDIYIQSIVRGLYDRKLYDAFREISGTFLKVKCAYE